MMVRTSHGIALLAFVFHVFLHLSHARFPPVLLLRYRQPGKGKHYPMKTRA